MITRVEIPPADGRAIKVAKGSRVTVKDPYGSQIGDTWAISLEDPTEWLSAGHTRIGVERLFPKAGECFYTNRLRQILRLLRDDSPGVHDMLHPACCPFLYKHWLGVEGHRNCSENFRRVTEELGIVLPAVPQPVNLFQNTPVVEGGDIHIGTAAGRPGDSVEFEALMDLVFVVTACAVDWNEVNGKVCTGLEIEVDGPTIE